MRHTLLPLLLLLAAASPAAAQSCATLGGGVDCGAPSRQPVKPMRPPAPARDAESHGNAETTLSNQGASTTLNNRVIDSHGVTEFGFRGSMRTPCRVPGYGSPCE
jgi:hypothetical protein